MKRIEIQSRIGEVLSSTKTISYIVKNPDHPLAYENPDLLAIGPSKILLFFLPTKHEILDPNFLVARLTICRMAYPKESVCILFGNENEMEEIWHSSSHFDSVLGTSEIDGLNKFAAAPPKGKMSSSSNIKLRSEWQKAFHRRLALSEEKSVETRINILMNASGTKIKKGEPLRIIPWESRYNEIPRPRIFRNARVVNNVIVIFQGSRGGQPAIRRSANITLWSRYVVDGGIPYKRSIEYQPVHLCNPSISLIRDYDLAHFDPGWNRRVISFSGGIALPEDITDQDLNRILEAAQDRRRKL